MYFYAFIDFLRVGFHYVPIAKAPIGIRWGRVDLKTAAIKRWFHNPPFPIGSLATGCSL